MGISKVIEIKNISDSIMMYCQTGEIKPDSALVQSSGTLLAESDFVVGDLYEIVFIEDLINGIILEYWDYRQTLDERFANDIYIKLLFRINNLPINKPLEFKNQKLYGCRIPVIVLGEMWINELRINPRDLYETSAIIAPRTGRILNDVSEVFLKRLSEKAENLDGKHRSFRADSEIGVFFNDDEDGHINAFIELLEVMDNVFGTSFLTLYQTANENARQCILRRTPK